MERDDAAETAIRGKSLAVLTEAERPCCVGERGFFMAPFEFTRTKSHPYSEYAAATHGHLRPTTLRHPPYSADAVPFRWMRTEQLEHLWDTYRLDLDPQREPELEFKSGKEWLQQRENQGAVLDWFFGHVRPDESLCFFYAKRTPLAEDPRRVIVGVGLVSHVSENKEYDYAAPPAGEQLRSLLWERLVQHSIRPDSTGVYTSQDHPRNGRAAVSNGGRDASGNRHVRGGVQPGAGGHVGGRPTAGGATGSVQFRRRLAKVGLGSAGHAATGVRRQPCPASADRTAMQEAASEEVPVHDPTRRVLREEIRQQALAH
jgi:hypothetical protein